MQHELENINRPNVTSHSNKLFGSNSEEYNLVKMIQQNEKNYNKVRKMNKKQLPGKR